VVHRGFAIHNEGVEKCSLFAATLGMTLAACEHTQVTEASFASSNARIEEPSEETVTEEVRSEPTEARPRLSKTVTLGQGQETPYVPAAAPTGARAGTNVVVNNNVVVVGGAPAYGGYGGYGYGYGYGYGAGARGRVDGRAATLPRGTSSWSTTGWEGPQRTARPGQTPGVAGNWSPPPSSGPTQMK
jgi:hypothetical protein